jgi:hypothetical protein
MLLLLLMLMLLLLDPVLLKQRLLTPCMNCDDIAHTGAWRESGLLPKESDLTRRIV